MSDVETLDEAVNEFDELQLVLGDDEPNRPTQAMEGKSAHSKYAAVNLSQWRVGANDHYLACGSTVNKLPPGIYKLDVDGNGQIHFVLTKVLTDNLIDLEDTASDRVIAGIKFFWQSQDKFLKRGILYKRGVLLWGPAGSGKTVTVMLLTNHLIAAGGLVILCDNPTATIMAMKELRRIESERPLIIILEDIEELISRYGEHDLLALLDGEHQVDNVVHIATTNYPEQLGARIVNRPSRFDEVIRIPMPSALARRQYLSNVLGSDVDEATLTTWVTDTENMSIAHLRELVVATQCLKRPYEETIERLKHMQVKPKSSDMGTGAGFGK